MTPSEKLVRIEAALCDVRDFTRLCGPSTECGRVHKVAAHALTLVRELREGAVEVVYNEDPAYRWCGCYAARGFEAGSQCGHTKHHGAFAIPITGGTDED